MPLDNSPSLVFWPLFAYSPSTTLFQPFSKSLLYIGYIDKRLKTKTNIKNKKKEVAKKSKAKKTTSETYAIIASKLRFEKDEFKKACLDVLNIEIKDMRKKCPKNQKQKIIKSLRK